MKSMILACLMAVCSTAALAAPAKTSKPTPLADTEMASVKGQSNIYVFVWNHMNSGQFYTTLNFGGFIGYNGYAYQLVYSGGPFAGTYFIGSESYPPDPPETEPAYYNFDWINRNGMLNVFHPFLNPNG